MQSEEQRLTLLLEERDQELQKAVELGHTLLGRISSLEKRETKHAAELSDVKKKHESLNNEYNALVNRFKNLDEINVAVKNERNKLSLELQEMRQSLIKFREDAVSHERVMDNNTKLRSRVEQLETIIANLRLENQRREQREAVQTPTSPVKQSAMLDSFSKSPVALPDVQVQELTQKNEELSKAIETATADNKKLVSKIEDLSNRVASLQTEKDMAQIQFRVQTNELRQEKEELKIKLSSYKPIGKKDLTDQLFHLEKLRQTLTDTKTYMQQQTEKFEGEIEQIQTVLGEMAGVPQSSSPTASRQFLEMSYALLQQKLIQELGLDDYFTCKSVTHI